MAYIQPFEFVSSGGARRGQPDPASGMHSLKRSLDADGTRVGYIVPLLHLVSPVQLIPKFGEQADARLTMQTCLEYSTEFWLNKYEEKEVFWAIHSTT